MVLIIIDLQESFISLIDEEQIATIVNEIDSASKKGWKIIVLEYNRKGNTINDINEELKKHKYITLRKDYDDGSNEIRKFLTYDPEIFHICGLKTSACVSATLFGLVKKFHKTLQFKIIASACSDITLNYHLLGFDDMIKKDRRVTVSHISKKLFKEDKYYFSLFQEIFKDITVEKYYMLTREIHVS